MRNPKYPFHLAIVLRATFMCIGVLFGLNGYSQLDCCNDSEKITICFYSADEICPPGNECRYTLDGDFMRNSLMRKLLNPALFGQNGISQCPIELEPLGTVESVEFLEETGCNIMFIGAFSDYLNGAFLPSDIPVEELITINEWSTKCPNNLTIVTQSEAEPWGYNSTNINVNPNIPDPLFSAFSIFNGAFGQVSQFNQGGSYQGVFDEFPATGYSVLARDDNDGPTVVLDSLTNDIILGDIGILCGSLVGPLSTGDQVIFDNDILACNLFDLGCQIASNFFTDFIDICEGNSHTTPGGQVVTEEGIYVDTLLTTLGCDSLIYSVVEVFEAYESTFEFSSCDSDEFEIMIGNTLYNQANKSGTEILTTSLGCDSIINVNLFFTQTDTTYLVESICQGESFTVGNINFTEAITTEIILEENGLCDSVVYLDLFLNDSYESFIMVDLCSGESHIASDGTVLSTTGAYAEYYTNQNQCDSIITTIVTVNDEYAIDEIYQGCSNDGYSLQVGNTMYNESNPSGIEYMISSRGCDSIVSVNFNYEPLDSTYLDFQFCPYESIEIGGVEYSGNRFEQINLSSSANCDSVIFLSIDIFRSQGVFLDSVYDINLNEEFAFDIPEVTGSNYDWISNGGLDCNVCPEPGLDLNDLPSSIQLNYEDKFNCTYSSEAILLYRCTPFFSNIMNANSPTEENRFFKIEALCDLDQYSLKVFDRWGNQVFRSENQEECWDGRYNGKLLAQGVYVYVLNYEIQGLNQQVTGSLTLIH